MKRSKRRFLFGKRRGVVAVLIAVLLVPLMAMLAFAVDCGYIMHAKAELQNAADAAALAGAAKLLVPQVGGTTSTGGIPMVSLATSEAQKFSVLNTAGNHTLSLASSDIVVGYMSSPTNQSQGLTAWSSGPLPNSIRVLVRRDTTVNTPLNTFFARVLGINNCSAAATATASYVPTTTTTGFKSTAAYAKLLPIAVDVNFWNTFISTGKSPDGTISDNFSATLPNSTTQAPNNVSSGADGVPEFNDVYPNSNSPGNFGLISIGAPATSTPSFRNWIDNGASPSDLSYFGSDGLQATPSNPATMAGGPGLKSTLVSDLASVVGQPREVPLFSSVSGNGANTQYTVVGFAGVTIVSATGSGHNIQVVVQPTTVIDPTAVSNSNYGASGSSFIYTYSPVQLVR